MEWDQKIQQKRTKQEFPEEKSQVIFWCKEKELTKAENWEKLVCVSEYATII